MEENLLYGMITHIDRPGRDIDTDNTVYLNHKNFGLILKCRFHRQSRIDVVEKHSQIFV